jgi:hypothetical protein
MVRGAMTTAGWNGAFGDVTVTPAEAARRRGSAAASAVSGRRSGLGGGDVTAPVSSPNPGAGKGPATGEGPGRVPASRLSLISVTAAAFPTALGCGSHPAVGSSCRARARGGKFGLGQPGGRNGRA